MLTIFHGDDEVKLHLELVGAMDAAKKRGVQIVRLTGKSLTIAEIENALGTQELFASEKLLIIDGLLSLPKSKAKDELIAQVILSVGQHTQTEVLLIENKIATATQLKPFGAAKITVFKLPVILFHFIEQIGIEKPIKLVAMFHQILETQGAEFVFAMLIRQVRTLIAFVSDGTYQGPPFGRQKVERQAKNFTIKKLLTLHQQLLSIDARQKTSRNSLTLTQEIDLLLSGI